MNWKYFLLLAWLPSAFPGTCWGAASVLTGTIDGSEPRAPAVSQLSCRQQLVPYQEVKFQVTHPGTYRVAEIFFHLGNRGQAIVTHEVYQDAFDPQRPEVNLLSEHNDFGALRVRQLDSGRTYVLVVRQHCYQQEGSWAVSLVGPGKVVSDHAANVPEFTAGTLDSSSPKMTMACGNRRTGARYSQSGRVRISRSGTYYFSSLPEQDGALCMTVYAAPFEAIRPEWNVVATLDYAGMVELQAGRDYHFVIHWADVERSGEFHYVLAPPAPFRINPGLTDSWFNPETPGQGVFLDVYDTRNLLFLGWFTFEPGTSSGPTPQRWLTALGPFEGGHAALDLEWTTRERARGAATATVKQSVVGTVDLEFTDCLSGTLTYSWQTDPAGGQVVSGTFPIRRIANDGRSECERQYAGPGMPGPL